MAPSGGRCVRGALRHFSTGSGHRSWVAAVLLSVCTVVVDTAVAPEYIYPEIFRDGAYRHTLELKYDNSVQAAGRNDFGQLGDGTVRNRQTPVE
ncbi:unnamed protein product, partial [Polarella glacialis]